MGRASSSSGSCRSLRTRARRDPSVAPTARVVSRLRQDARSARACTYTPGSPTTSTAVSSQQCSRSSRRAADTHHQRGGRTKGFQQRSAAGSPGSRGGGCGPARAQDGFDRTGARLARTATGKRITGQMHPTTPGASTSPDSTARKGTSNRSRTASRSLADCHCDTVSARATTRRRCTRQQPPATSRGAPSRPQASPTRQPEDASSRMVPVHRRSWAMTLHRSGFAARSRRLGPGTAGERSPGARALNQVSGRTRR